MKVLVAGDFDACAVHHRQRKWLRELGVEVRIAIKRVYWREHEQADYFLPRDHEAAQVFARSADLVVFLPCLEQPWSSSTTEPRFESHPFETDAPALYVFHGSVNAAANMAAYASHYGARGTVAATTLEYAVGMGCEYVPGIVELTARAQLRGQGQPLRINHSPSDPSVCSTAEFREVAKGRGQLDFVMGMSHEQAMKRKLRAHVGFDHLRGAFSLNSLENASVGLVNLVGMSEAATELAERLGVLPDWPRVRTMEDVSHWLERLACNPAETADWQNRGYHWFQDNWQPFMVAPRIATIFRKAASV